MNESTKTVDVTETRRTTPSPFAPLACIMGHQYRVVIRGVRPIVLECVRCAKSWQVGESEGAPGE